MICGGVAINSGDFLCTITVDLCLEAAAYPEEDAGENAAVVSGCVSYAWEGDVGPSLLLYAVDLDIEAIQSVSDQISKPIMMRSRMVDIPKTDMQIVASSAK